MVDGNKSVDYLFVVKTCLRAGLFFHSQEGSKPGLRTVPGISKLPDSMNDFFRIKVAFPFSRLTGKFYR